MSGAAGLITYPTSGRIGKLADLLAAFAASVNTALPVKFAAKLSDVNALQLDAATLPAGTLAILAADDSGLAAGAEFIMNPDGKWRLSGSATANNIATFVTALGTNTNVKTLPGTIVYNLADSTLYSFTSTSGDKSVVLSEKMVSGTYTTTDAVGVGQSIYPAITFPAGSFSATPSQILVTSEASRFTVAANQYAATGFVLQISNWSNGAQASGVVCRWTALA